MHLKFIRFIDIWLGIPAVYLLYLLSCFFTFWGKEYPSGQTKKILAIKFWGIGNLIMIMPTLKALRDKYPLAQVSFLTLSDNRAVTKTLGLNGKFYFIDNFSLAAFIASSLKALSDVRRDNFDVIIDFEQFARFSALFSFISGVKKRIGFKTLGQYRHFLYTDSIDYNNTIHMTRSFFSLLGKVGLPLIADIRPEPLFLPDKAFSDVKDILSANSVGSMRIVVLHVGTSENFNLRRWPLEHFAQLAKILMDELPSAIVITGNSHEVYLTSEVRERISTSGVVVDLGGKLDFEQFAALVKMSTIVISADTAPVHIASCFNTPVVGLYGPNTPVLYGPWGKNGVYCYERLNCSPCITNYNAKINKCRHTKGQGYCMKQITPQTVFSLIKEKMGY